MRRIGLFLLLLVLPLAAEESSDFAAIAKAGHEMVREHGAHRVVIVFDIDNTLLTMDQDLGGDAWFNWQAGLLKSEPESPLLVAPDFAGLLRVQGILFSLSGMHPPEKETPALVAKLQETGALVIALSSRGPEYWSATQRVLAENRYDFTRAAWRGRPGTFLPFESGFSDEERAKWKLTSPRPVMYQGGVYLAAGQHKGAILREVLDRYKGNKAVLFVDDHEKHLDRVKDALEGCTRALRLFRYTRMDGQVERFAKSDKKAVAAQWLVLKSAIDRVIARPPAREPAKEPEKVEPTR